MNEDDTASPRQVARVWQTILLAGVLLALRVPFLSHPIPVHPDESAFLDGLGFPRIYPVHPPGYFGWIALGTAMHDIGFSPYAAYQVWCVFASIAAPMVLYCLCARRLPVGLAWWTALALGVNPLVSFWGVTAMTYVPAMCFAVLVAGICLHDAGRPTAAGMLAPALACLLLGMAIRPDLLVFMGPLLLAAAWQVSRRTAFGFAGLILLGLALMAGITWWLYSRDAASEMAARFAHNRDVFFGTSVVALGVKDGLARNAVKLLANAGWSLGLAAPLFAWAAVVLWRRRSTSRPVWLMTLWLVPGGLFLLLTHVAQGYLLPLIPAMLLLIAMALHDACSARRARGVMATVAICSAAQFLLYPWSAESAGIKRGIDAKFAFQSAQGLLKIDQRERIHFDGDLWPTAAHGPTRPTTETARD